MEMNGASNSSDSSCNSLGDEADYDLEHPAWGLEELRCAADEQRLPRPRALAWAALLGALPAPRDPAPLRAALQAGRAQYEELQRRLSRDPRAAAGDDPLSQRHESVWRQHFCDQELRALILQDVARTFPGDLYFRGPHVQDLMVRVLFLWARSHAALGYRQGMHEVLAPLLFQLFLDRELAPAGASDAVRLVLSADHLEHDSYALFAAVMTGLERFYTTGDMIAPTAYGRKLSKNPNEVLRYLDRVREDFLLPLDRELAAHLAACNVSMELFGIRWLRLLFGREFPRAALAELWGFLFAAGPALPDLGLLVAALLIANRHRLLEPEPGAVLAALMRPSAAPVPHVLALARHLRSPAQHARPPALHRYADAFKKLSLPSSRHVRPAANPRYKRSKEPDGFIF